jgi:IclR family acetate operon transcriptional repressor
MPRTGSPATRHVAAVERAVAVLDALAAAGELGTNDVARRARLSASTASRQLATLAAAGLVEHLAGSGRYRLGHRLVELGNAALARLDLRELARPQLRQLVDVTGETATLSVPGGRDAITIDYVQSPASVQSIARLGRPSIGHATAAGKIVLAFGPGAAEPPLERFTERTIVAAAELERELERVRRNGTADAVEEREPGLSAVAAPVFGPGRELIGVLGVQGPAERFDAVARAAAAAAAATAAGQLSTALGYRSSS